MSEEAKTWEAKTWEAQMDATLEAVAQADKRAPLTPLERSLYKTLVHTAETLRLAMVDMGLLEKTGSDDGE